MIDFDKFIEDGLAEAAQYEPCMALCVREHDVELLLETSLNTYRYYTMLETHSGNVVQLECIIDRDTEQIVGVCLPLLNQKLGITHDGPIRINAGFRKGETP